MKIIRKSNHDYDGPRGNERVVAMGIASKFLATRVADGLNLQEAPESDDFYVAVDDDYVLPPPWEP